MVMMAMFAANRTTTDSTSTSTSLQITTMEFCNLSCVLILFAGIGIKNANIESMFVVVDISKCPTRLQELCHCLWPVRHIFAIF